VPGFFYRAAFARLPACFTADAARLTAQRVDTDDEIIVTGQSQGSDGAVLT